MTQLSSKVLVCPECESEQEFVIYDSLNVSLNPDAKEKLISGELTIFTCYACGNQVDVVYPMIYHDMDKKVMIWMDTEGLMDPNDLGEKLFMFDLLDKSYRYRIVSSRTEMAEKILIFDDDLDDKPLELLKYYCREVQLSEGDDPEETILLYGGREVFENEGEVVLIDKPSGPDPNSYRIPIEKYQQIKEYTDVYPGPLPVAGPWLRVDEDYFKVPDEAKNI